MTKEELRKAAEAIDKLHDSMLYDGMPRWLARQVEDERAKAHDRMTQEVLRKALR